MERWLTRVTRVLVAIMLVVVCAACQPYIGVCGWIELTGVKGIQVTAPRRPVVNECNCLFCNAPGVYELRREQYVMEFWNGDRWYPELSVRIRGRDGGRLSLRGKDLLPLGLNRAGYDYYVFIATVQGGASPSFKFPPRLVF